MTADQNAFFQMLAAVRATTDSFTPAWTSYSAFADTFAVLKSDVLDTIPNAIAQQTRPSKGVTEDKTAARLGLETDTRVIAGAIEALATVNDNKTLRAEAHLSASVLARLSDDALLGKAMSIAGLAMANLAALAAYNVTPAQVTAFRTAIADYAEWKGKPRAAIASKRDGTDLVEDIELLGRELLAKMDAMMAIFEVGDTSFYRQYWASRKLLTPPTHHRALVFTAVDGKGLPLEDVTIEVPALKLVKKTGESGTCRVQSAPAGMYVGKAWKNGYKAEALEIPVNSGETTEVKVVLTRMVGSPGLG